VADASPLPAPDAPACITPVDQDRFGRGEGNCFAASMATITGIDLQQLTEELGMGSGGTWEGDVWVPNYAEEHWLDRAHRVMREHGWTLFHTSTQPSGFSIASGPTVRGLLHATVALDGAIVHDPHPSRDGLLEIIDWISVTRTVVAHVPS
jgi:hypothetical protein